MSKLKIGYFTDMHLRENVPGTSKSVRRQCRMMKRRLEECMELFRKQKVDLVVCTGDMIDDATQPQVPEDLAVIRNIIDTLDVPNLMIPGNHDPYPGVFYEVFEQPGFLNVMGRTQVISSIDHPDEGSEACTRDPRSVERLSKALAYKPENIDLAIAFQHYLIYPPNLKGYPYNYTNDAAIRSVLEASKTKVLSISGHYHRGIDPVEHNGVRYFAGKALCEEPFPCYTIIVDGADVEILEHTVIS